MGQNFSSSISSSSSSSSSASVSASVSSAAAAAAAASVSSVSASPTVTTAALTLKELRRIRVVDMANGGTVQDIPSPIPVSQFLLHHRNFLLCDSASIRVGKRPCPLRPSVHLAPGHLYLLLPLATFQKRIMPSSCSFSASLLLLLLQQQEDKHMPQPKKVVEEDHWWKRITKSNRIVPSPPTMFFTASSCRNIVCDSDPDAVSRYIEQLINRSNSWRPDLDAIEEILSHSSTCTNGDAGAGGGAGAGAGAGGGSVHLILHMDEEVVRVRDQNPILPPVPTLTKASRRDQNQSLPPVPTLAKASRRDQNQSLPPVPTLTKASSRWSAERQDGVMSSIIWSFSDRN